MALSAHTQYTIRNNSGMTRLNGIIKTSQVIYHHALVVQNAAGTLKVAANETSTTFHGLAIVTHPTAVTTGLTGDGTVRVDTVSDIDVLLPLKTSVTVGMVGHQKMYAFDDATATNLATLGPEIGTLVEFVAANSGWVRLRCNVMVKAS